MNEFELDHMPSQLRVAFTLLLCVAVAAFITIFAEYAYSNSPVQIAGDSYLPLNLIKLLAALLLCAFTFRQSGLTLGDKLQWERRWPMVVLFWLMPPLLTFIVYPLFTGKPFQGAPVGMWLVGPIAEELLFSGFMYGQMEVIFGKPGQNWKGAFGAAPLITAFLFALYHWPNLRFPDAPGHQMGFTYAKFQLLYTFMGSLWLLNIRRWTGSIWPLVLNHILVNFLACVL